MKKTILILFSILLLIACDNAEQEDEGSLNVPDRFHGTYQVVNTGTRAVITQRRVHVLGVALITFADEETYNGQNMYTAENATQKLYLVRNATSLFIRVVDLENNRVLINVIFAPIEP